MTPKKSGYYVARLRNWGSYLKPLNDPEVVRVDVEGGLVWATGGDVPLKPDQFHFVRRIKL